MACTEVIAEVDIGPDPEPPSSLQPPGSTVGREAYMTRRRVETSIDLSINTYI
jgi:hypothetical protein